MTAKKNAARKQPAAKSAKAAKPSTRKAPAAKAAKKPAPKAAAAKAAPVKAAPAPAPKAAVVKAAAPKAKAADAPKTAAKPLGVIKPIVSSSENPKAAPKKAAASRARPSATTSFDPDRRRELIAAAAARHRKAPAKAPIAPIVIAPRQQPAIIERHRFSVGDEVRVISTSGMWFKHGVDYRVTAALPPQAGKLQYRIKNDMEPFERVVSESQLAFAAGA